MKALKQSLITILSAAFMIVFLASVAHGLPNPGMQIDPERTALVITDPQNDFLSPGRKGQLHPLVLTQGNPS